MGHLSVPRVSWATTLVVVLSLVSGCGFQRGPESDARQANDALNAGLKAQTEAKTQEAVDDYKKCLAHDPANKFCRYNLGVIDQSAGRTASAEQDYRAALSIDPDFAPALFNLAIVRTEPSPTEAGNLYRHVISLEPANAAAHLNLGFVLKSMGREDEGNAELQRAVHLDPKLVSRLPAGVTAISPSPSHK